MLTWLLARYPSQKTKRWAMAWHFLALPFCKEHVPHAKKSSELTWVLEQTWFRFLKSVGKCDSPPWCCSACACGPVISLPEIWQRVTMFAECGHKDLYPKNRPKTMTHIISKIFSVAGTQNSWNSTCMPSCHKRCGAKTASRCTLLWLFIFGKCFKFSPASEDLETCLVKKNSLRRNNVWDVFLLVTAIIHEYI